VTIVTMSIDMASVVSLNRRGAIVVREKWLAS
jgi:hypothetical protein